MTGETPSRPGRLLVVATPIGNLEDITLRALRALREADLIAAEDTRHTRKLLAHFDIHTPLTSFYQHRQFRQAPGLVSRMLGGAAVALVTDAGTPGISDPGAVLVRMALEAGIDVTPVPGPAAAIALLSVSGLDTHAFVFEGFLPVKSGRRRRALEALAAEARTLVFYESPHRLVRTLEMMLEVFGDRPAAVGRELTKVFEEITRGTLAAALERYRGRPVKGEIAIAVAGSSSGARRRVEAPATDDEDGEAEDPGGDDDPDPNDDGGDDDEDPDDDARP
ncbi:MAG TPA: 16S rRNA (cytidine(1402)-2'-O)-methyltransferase [bacterium]